MYPAPDWCGARIKASFSLPDVSGEVRFIRTAASQFGIDRPKAGGRTSNQSQQSATTPFLYGICSLFCRRFAGILGTERDGGLVVEPRDGGREVERRDGGRGVKRWDGGRGIERRDGGHGVERWDGGVGSVRSGVNRGVLFAGGRRADMILSDGDILRRLEEGDLVVEPLDDPELQVQPASVDQVAGLQSSQNVRVREYHTHLWAPPGIKHHG